MKTFRRFCAFLLALATLFSLAGCVNHNWSVKTDDESIAAGVYIYYMMTAYNDAVAKVDDEKTDVLTATIDGKPGRQWILDEARNYCKRHFAVDKLCAERNVTLSDEDKTSINNTLNYMVSYYGSFFDEAGISIDSVRAIYENSYLYSNLLFSYYDGKGEHALKEEEIKKYFSENYFAYKSIDAPFSYTSNNKKVNYADSEIKLRKELLNGFYDESKMDGADIDAFNKKYQNRNLKEGEEEKKVDPLKLQFATEETVTTTYGDTFFKDLKAAKVGDFLKYETKDGIYLIQKCDEYSDKGKDDEKYKAERENCIAAIAEDDFIEILTKKADTMNFTFNERALDKYELDDLIELLTTNNQ
ncbi:MAG: hypothetical protein IKU25_00715 [Clostridia bacterium]|nr:hypothetical protein [Clostridia bacterium]